MAVEAADPQDSRVRVQVAGRVLQAEGRGRTQAVHTSKGSTQMTVPESQVGDKATVRIRREDRILQLIDEVDSCRCTIYTHLPRYAVLGSLPSCDQR